MIGSHPPSADPDVAVGDISLELVYMATTRAVKDDVVFVLADEDEGLRVTLIQ
jgi:hypothetical protein